VSFPATFKISCSTCAGVLSSQIKFSLTNPYPLGLVSMIRSPLSCTCNFSRAAYLYTSYLFLYSACNMEMLHRISPLWFRMPWYNYLLLDFVGHSMTSLISPGGALTLWHPVMRAASCPRCWLRASFHCSRSPLYLLFCISRVTLLYIYNQQERSGSTVFVFVLLCTVFHGSVFF
jgi:hypothetical protein